jgi:hypothetical protein
VRTLFHARSFLTESLILLQQFLKSVFAHGEMGAST